MGNELGLRIAFEIKKKTLEKMSSPLFMRAKFFIR